MDSETLKELYDWDGNENAVSGADIDGIVWTEEEFRYDWTA
jgi:hypothetical protein